MLQFVASGQMAAAILRGPLGVMEISEGGEQLCESSR
jgi:hypothetical protein